MTTLLNPTADLYRCQAGLEMAIDLTLGEVALAPYAQHPLYLEVRGLALPLPATEGVLSSALAMIKTMLRKLLEVVKRFGRWLKDLISRAFRQNKNTDDALKSANRETPTNSEVPIDGAEGTKRKSTTVDDVEKELSEFMAKTAEENKTNAALRKTLEDFLKKEGRSDQSEDLVGALEEILASQPVEDLLPPDFSSFKLLYETKDSVGVTRQYLVAKFGHTALIAHTRHVEGKLVEYTERFMGNHSAGNTTNTHVTLTNVQRAKEFNTYLGKIIDRYGRAARFDDEEEAIEQVIKLLTRVTDKLTARAESGGISASEAAKAESLLAALARRLNVLITNRTHRANYASTILIAHQKLAAAIADEFKD